MQNVPSNESHGPAADGSAPKPDLPLAQTLKVTAPVYANALRGWLVVEDPTNLGSGAALVTVTTECERCMYSAKGRGWILNCGWIPCPDCTDGIRSLRVKLPGEALPIVDGSKPEGYDPAGRNYGRMITVDSDGLCRIGDDWDGWEVLDLGPDPAQYIGWFAFRCESVTSNA